MSASIFHKSILLVCALALSACAAGRGGNIPYDVQNFGTPDAPVAAVSLDSYRIVPLDTVTIAVFQVSDLSRDYTVDVAGNVTMPLIGSVTAINKSTSELAEIIQQRLGERYLTNPNVTVALKASASRVVTVDGGVNAPGLYPATGPLTLLQVVAQARGVSENGNAKRVAIFRQIEGKRMAAAFDLVSIRRGEVGDPPIYAGDTVIVDGNGVGKAKRDVLQNIPLLSLFLPLL